MGHSCPPNFDAGQPLYDKSLQSGMACGATIHRLATAHAILRSAAHRFANSERRAKSAETSETQILTRVHTHQARD